MKKLSFYLVGPIQYVDDYFSWRQKMSDFLHELGHNAEFPWGEVYHSKWMRGEFKRDLKKMKREDWLKKVRRYMRAQVIRFDLQTLLKSDGIIFYIPKGTRTVGSYGEQTLAYYLKVWEPDKKGKKFARGKRIFVIAEDPIEDLSYWMIGCSDWIFSSLDEFRAYFKNNFNRNKKRKKK